MKNKFLINISWLVFDKIIRILGGLLVVIWVARYLGPNDFGIFNYAVAYSALFVVFVKLGLDQIVIREIVKKTEATNCLLGTAFCLKLIGSLVAIFTIYFSLFFLKADTLTKTVIFVLSAGYIFQSIDVIDFYFQSKILSKYVVVARNSAFILSSVLKIYFLIFKYTLLFFAAANLVDMFLSAVFLVLIYKKTGHKISKWRFKKEIATKLILYSWPLGISIFFISVHMKIDRIMIGSLLNAEQVGFYSVAARLSESWYFIPAILVSTMMPYLIELRESNKELYSMKLMQLYSLMFWLGAGAGLFVTFWGDNLIRLLFGDAYVAGYVALVYNVWNGIFVSQALARGIWMISENLQKYRLYSNIAAASFNVIANLILIPKFGIAGAAMATLLTQVLGVWVFSLIWQPLRIHNWVMIRSINPLCLTRMIHWEKLRQ